MNSIATPKYSAFLMVLIMCISLQGMAQSQGPNNPANASESSFACLSCPGSQWPAFNNIKTLNDTFAITRLLPFDSCTIGVGSCFFSRGLLASNFGFTIPLSATITGVQVNIVKKASVGGAVNDSVVQLLKGTVEIQGVNHASAAYWSTTASSVAYGGPGDLWGVTWTAAEIDSTGFGVELVPSNHLLQFDSALVDNINVTVYYSGGGSLPVAGFAASDSVICAGDTVHFTDQSIGIALFDLPSWDFPGAIPDTSDAPNPTVTYPTAGQYSVTIHVYNVYGTDSLTKTNYITVNAIPSTPTITHSGDTLTSSASSGNQWYRNDSLIAGAVSQQYIATDTGSYSVVVSSAGCTATSASVQVIATGLSSISADFSLLNISPNPSNGDFIVHFTATTTSQSMLLRISDVSGKIILSRNIQSFNGDNQYRLNLDKKVPAGIYFIELRSDNYATRQKLVIAE